MVGTLTGILITDTTLTIGHTQDITGDTTHIGHGAATIIRIITTIIITIIIRIMAIILVMSAVSTTVIAVL